MVKFHDRNRYTMFPEKCMQEQTVNKEIRSIVRFPLYILAFVMLGLIFGYLTFKVLSFSRTVEVPDLYGKSLLEGNKLLGNKSLYLKIEGEDYDAVIPSGNIIRQDVPAGNKVKERRGIKVVISKGQRIKSVPLLVDETLINAESLLLQKGLKIAKVVPVHSDVVEKDRILAQKPGPEDQVSDMITVLVSLGPYEKRYRCPDFTGMSFEQATALVKQLNLKVTAEGSGETVEAQKPEPGKQIKTGDTIYLKLF
ncbi:MAG TPA: PASTA domain-containing protein [Thermodesulfovibrionales bacterium]|nr:PASTA domain-containing protein [Thermodesulfovibrionales bacterium]